MENKKFVTLDLENETVLGTIKWCQQNPEAWNRLQNLALDKAQRNEKRIGARALVERMRWDFERTHIPNVYVTVIARLLEIMYPGTLDGLFQKTKSDVDKEYETDIEKYKVNIAIDYALENNLDPRQVTVNC